MATNQMFSNSQRTLELLAKMFNLSLELDTAPKHWHVAISFKKKIPKVTLRLMWCFRSKKLVSYVLFTHVIEKQFYDALWNDKMSPKVELTLTKWYMQRTRGNRETTGGNLCQYLVSLGKVPGQQIHQKIKEKAHLWGESRPQLGKRN